MTRQYELVLLGDSCSGIPGHAHEGNFRRVREALLARRQYHRALCYLGDHVSGYVDSESELRLQWSYFIAREFAPLARAFDRVFHIPGNHDAFDSLSRDLCGEFLPGDGLGGLIDRNGLNFAVRDEDALLVFLNTADASNYGRATMDVSWLERALAAGKDASVKLVFGHHPVHPVNGYGEYPRWRIAPETGGLAWSLMRRHGVQAYLCSHIIAFDFQVRDGVVQLCTGGAGTEYGPHGAMPGDVEYRHFVECSVSPTAFSYQVFDDSAHCRERLTWPAESIRNTEVAVLSPGMPAICGASLNGGSPRHDGFFARWLIHGPILPNGADIAFVVGREASQSPPVFRIEWDSGLGRIAVRLRPDASRSERLWLGPELDLERLSAVEIGVHSGGGPGGVMGRFSNGDWSSLETSSPRGLEGMRWPSLWEAPASLRRAATPCSGHIEMKLHRLPP